MHWQKRVHKFLKLFLFLILITNMSMVLVGCSDISSGAPTSDTALVENADDHDCDGTQTKNDSPEIDGDLDTNQGQNVEKERKEFATLYVYGALSVESIAKDGCLEYTLSSEDSDVIITLFYNHEKETLETPLECISTIEFRLGDDYLATSLNGINVLSGRIDGNLVAMYLGEDESSLLKQLVYTYAPDIAY